MVIHNAIRYNFFIMEKTKTSFKGVIILLITALIWGSSFIAQRFGTDSGVQPFTFQGIRTLLGACVLLPFIFVRDAITAKKMTEEQLAERKKNNKKSVIYGAICGVVFCAAINLQQWAFVYEESAGKIAFITAMYMFLVPIIGLFFKKRVPFVTWICVIIGFAGLYFLCIKGTGFGGINLGDWLAFGCAIFFCLQILLLERFAPDCDGIKLSCVQFLVGGFISLILMFIFDKPDPAALKAAVIPILYSGVLSCGLAYTLQVVGQKYCEATIASLLMCMESVFAVLSEAVIIHKIPTKWEILGCVIMFAAIIISQLSDLVKKKNNKNSEEKENSDCEN